MASFVKIRLLNFFLIKGKNILDITFQVQSGLTSTLLCLAVLLPFLSGLCLNREQPRPWKLLGPALLSACSLQRSAAGFLSRFYSSADDSLLPEHPLVSWELWGRKRRRAPVYTEVCGDPCRGKSLPLLGRPHWYLHRWLMQCHRALASSSASSSPEVIMHSSLHL